MLCFALLAKRKSPAAPMWSHFSKESRWELMQGSCNIQLQPWVEKSDVRQSDLSPRWSKAEMVWLER